MSTQAHRGTEVAMAAVAQSLSTPVKDLFTVMCLYICSRPFNAKNKHEIEKNC